MGILARAGRKWAAFIRSAGEPEIRVRFDGQEGATEQRVVDRCFRAPRGRGNFFRVRLYNLSAGVQCSRQGRAP